MFQQVEMLLLKVKCEHFYVHSTQVPAEQHLQWHSTFVHAQMIDQQSVEDTEKYMSQHHRHFVRSLLPLPINQQKYHVEKDRPQNVDVIRVQYTLEAVFDTVEAMFLLLVDPVRTNPYLMQS